MRLVQRFIRDASAQDLIEYALLMAFVALASVALFVGMGGSISGIWTSADSQLSVANQSLNQTPSQTPIQTPSQPSNPVRHHDD